MHQLLKSISCLEDMVKERMRKDVAAEFERLELLTQLIRYGVCTCQCHFSLNVYHGAEPCCGNARLSAGS